MRRRLAGLGLLLVGAFLVVAEVAWRTGSPDPRLPRLPPLVGSAVVFLIGVLGLGLIAIGVALLRSK